MVGHDDAIDPERDAFLGIGGMENSLHHQRTLPALAIARDLVPGEGAAHFPPHEGRDLVHVRGVGGIGLEIAEARLPVRPQRSEIAGRAQYAGDHAQIRPERRGDAGGNLARTCGAHRNVEGKNQYMHPDRLGAAKQIEADRMLVARTAIELEPEHVGRDLGRALDRHPADESERIGNTRALRGGREILIGSRPHDRGAAHGRDTDRCGVAFAEHLDIDGRKRGGDAVARHQLDRIERVPVARDAAVRAGAAVHIFEGKARHISAGVSAQIGNGRKAAMQLGEARIVGRIVCGCRSRQSRRVVHGNAPPSSSAIDDRSGAGGCRQQRPSRAAQRRSDACYLTGHSGCCGLQR